MSYRFCKVAVLCAQKRGVYAHASGVVGQSSSAFSQFPGTDRQSSSTFSQLSGCDSQLSQVFGQIAVQVDLWDAKRNAFKFSGGLPVVAHPPCRLWASLKGLAKSPDADLERELGRHCVRMVIENGGVFEHPSDSDLFSEMGLPAAGYANEKGFTLEYSQRMFGHPMRKPTWFFFSGIAYGQVLPVVPVLNFEPLKQIEHLSAAQREATPPLLASWLLYHAAISQSGRHCSQFIEPVDQGLKSACLPGLEASCEKGGVSCS